MAIRPGMLSLRLDAVLCLIAGAAVAILSGRIAEVVALPAGIILAIGITVVAWAGLVEWMRAKLPLTRALRIVMIANIAASVAVAAAALAASTAAAVVVILDLAICIVLFAVSQAVALRKLDS